MPALGEQLDPRQPLKRLADALPWSEFEQAFGKYYSAKGRPAKPVRLMVGLPLLKQMSNQGDETVVAAWVQNPYWQYFCGMTDFQWTVVGRVIHRSCGEQFLRALLASVNNSGIAISERHFIAQRD